MNVAPEIQARIDTQLAADPNTVSPEVAKAALAEFQKRREDEQRETMVRRLNTVTNATTEAVEVLREARKAEKNAKTLLDSVAAAETAFKANGDWSAYTKAKDEAWNKYHRSQNE